MINIYYAFTHNIMYYIGTPMSVGRRHKAVNKTTV